MNARKTLVALTMVAAALGCSKEAAKVQAKTAAATVKQKVVDAVDDITAPDGKQDQMTAQQRQQARFDEQWRQLQSFKAQQAQQQQEAAATSSAPPPQTNIQFTTGKKETFKGLDANAINSAPVNLPITGDVAGPSVLKAQVYLDRDHFSTGSLDGRWGRNSAIAVWWWQRAHGLPATGDVDQATFRSIADAAGAPPAVTRYTITADDVAGPFVHIPESPYDKAKLDCLCYESLKEELGEKFHCSPDFLETLNPGVSFADAKAGDSITVPNIRSTWTQDTHDIAKVVVSLAGNSFSGFDAAGRLIFHAPTTVGNQYDPSPDETVRVVKVIPHPHFHYDPTLYHEVPDTMPDAHMNPGPNSPVGVVWIALSKEHYGVHGTEDPESIGYVSSHGCIRLTNWDAAEVSHRISEGTPVSFVDVSSRGLPPVAKK